MTKGRYQRCTNAKVAATPTWGLVTSATGKMCAGTLCGNGTTNNFIPAGPLGL